MPALSCAIQLEIIVVDLLDHLRQKRILNLTIGHTKGIRLSCLHLIVLRGCDLDLSANRLDSQVGAIRVDKLHHHFGRRSSSAWAKYADALRKISLARRSSLFSRSNAFKRSCSDCVTPWRRPRFSTSVTSTQPCPQSTQYRLAVSCIPVLGQRPSGQTVLESPD